jgi:hypothetical protein
MTASRLISEASRAVSPGLPRENFFAEVAFALAGCRHPSLKRAQLP